MSSNALSCPTKTMLAFVRTEAKTPPSHKVFGSGSGEAPRPATGSSRPRGTRWTRFGRRSALLGVSHMKCEGRGANQRPSCNPWILIWCKNVFQTKNDILPTLAVFVCEGLSGSHHLTSNMSRLCAA